MAMESFNNFSYFYQLNDSDFSPWGLGPLNGTYDFNNYNQSHSPPKEPKPYYGDVLESFHRRYTEIHGYLSVMVCIFGILANLLNIIVLTRKDMTSPTNAILTGLAVADMLVMALYLPNSVHTYVRINQPDKEKCSYPWVAFTMLYAHFTVVCHSISTWLTVTLAIWRFLAVTFPLNSKKWCSMFRAQCAIFSIYCVCPIFCVPMYLSFTIVSYEEDGSSLYKIDFSQISKTNDHLLTKTNFWIFSVFMKLIPCIALTGLSLGLIRALYEANIRKQRLRNRVECDRSCDRTTRMLLAVMLLFLITEFPSGILALLSGILGDDFFNNVYINFGEVMDILALINSAINFILYCTMSRQFRETFARLFTPQIVSKWIGVPVKPDTSCTTTCV